MSTVVSSDVVGLALVASILWGIANYSGGLVSREAGPWRAAMSIQAAVFVGLFPLALMVPGSWTWTVFGWGALASIAGIVGFVAMYAGLATGSMGVVAKLISGSMILVPLVCGVVQGERPSALELAGVALVLGSIIVLSIQPKKKREGLTHTSRRAIVMGLLAGIAFGVATITYGQTQPGDGSVVLLPFRGLIAIMIFGYLLARHLPISIPKGARKHLAISGAFSAVGDTMFIVALQNGALSLVPAIVSLHPGVTALAARYWSKEQIHGVQILGICIGLIGIVVMKL